MRYIKLIKVINKVKHMKKNGLQEMKNILKNQKS